MSSRRTSGGSLPTYTRPLAMLYSDLRVERERWRRLYWIGGKRRRSLCARLRVNVTGRFGCIRPSRRACVAERGRRRQSLTGSRSQKRDCEWRERPPWLHTKIQCSRVAILQGTREPRVGQGESQGQNEGQATQRGRRRLQQADCNECTPGDDRRRHRGKFAVTLTHTHRPVRGTDRKTTFARHERLHCSARSGRRKGTLHLY